MRSRPTFIWPSGPVHDLPVALSISPVLFEEASPNEFLDDHTRHPEKLRAKALRGRFERAAAEAGISASRSRQLRKRYAEPRPALIDGLGARAQPQRRQPSLAILSLPAVAGKFGVRGGGYSMSNTAAWGIERTWIGAQEPPTRLINMNQLGRALTELDPPVRVLFVYNSNAAVTSPDQRRIIRGLERDDLFTVGFEQVRTDTARYADVIHAATTFLEGYDLVRGYGHISLQLGKPVIEAVGEARPMRTSSGDAAPARSAEPGDPTGRSKRCCT